MSGRTRVTFNLFISFYLTSLLMFCGIMLFQKGYFLRAVNFALFHKKEILIISAILFCVLCFIVEKMEFVKKINFNSKLFYTIMVLLNTVSVSMILSIYLLYVQKDNFLNRTFQYIITHKPHFLVTFIIIFGLNLIFVAIIRNLYIANTIFGLVIFFIGQVHFNKLKILGEPLYPSDFSLVATIGEVLPMIRKNVNLLPIVLAVVLIVLIILVQRSMPKIRIHLIIRVALAAFGIFIVYSFMNYGEKWTLPYMQKAGIQFIRWNQPSNYAYNGPVIAFMGNFKKELMDKPSDYSKNKINSIVKNTPNENNVRPNGLGDLQQKPNIIFIMSESFWDASKLTGLHLQSDPIPTIHKIMSENTSGNLLSPTFGGGTANVEYEALTGQSNAFLRPGSMPYQDGLANKGNMPSIVSVLKDSGYSVEAMHPYNPAFYKRKEVYKRLGFTNFYSMGTMKHTDKFGNYISDESVTLELIDLLKKKDGPKFIHTVSMQNHLPYNKSDNNETYFNQLKPENNVILSNYFKGIEATDLAIKHLTDFLDTFDEPTMVVFWGDHMPSFGKDREIFSEAGYSAKTPVEDLRKFSETPFFVYTNYDTEKVHYESLSPSFLSTIVFDKTGLARPPYFDLLTQIRETVPGIKGANRLNTKGELITDLSTEQKQLIKNYEMVQYNLLDGKQYDTDELFKVK
ncbi:LTA synthase family protein [Gottfriedia luciferensis]|uniref:LTA synthase family protein n=1 Tax=Gottfriedia luciferensis TaxID=178774 RepID=UPI000B43915D|nr:LTA synthase family protein [Gottfriedia luciferensis]